MHVALDDRAVAEVGERHEDGVVSTGGAVGEEPAAPRSPGLGRESLCLLEGRGVGIGADVDALEPGGEVHEQSLLADRADKAGVRPATALVPRDVESAGVARRPPCQRIEVRSLRLIHAATVPLPGPGHVVASGAASLAGPEVAASLTRVAR